MGGPVVLDASALLASLYQEPGGEQVDAALSHAIIGAPNLAEVLGKVDSASWDDMLLGWSELGMQVEPMLPADAHTVGALATDGPRSGLSLGDRACIALALRLGVQAWTADRTWADPKKVGARAASVVHLIR